MKLSSEKKKLEQFRGGSTLIKYDPRPVFEILANTLMQAMKKKDWARVEELYGQIKALSCE
jgi:hypothetical protein